MGGPTFGRYQLGPQLAVGGMGEVFLATQLGLGAFAKPLVLKFLLPHLAQSPGAVEMFLTEARLASRMNHPNVVQIFDVGMIDGRYFIAMELVRGVSLSRLIEALRSAGRVLEPQLLMAVARSLCEGLHHAHEQVGPDGRPMSLIHRDITPENVLVSVDGQVKLTDFGVARAQDQGPDLRVVGKLGYIAPEILDGQPVDRRVDVYSLGVTLFALATLERPFTRGTRDETASAVRSGKLPDLRALRPDLEERLVAALERAADKEPGRRFATARELREALPPATRADAAEAIGALVLELCGHQVSALEERVERTAAMKLTQATGTALPSAQPKTRRRALAWGLAAAGLGGLLVFSSGRAASEAPVPREAVALAPGPGLAERGARPAASALQGAGVAEELRPEQPAAGQATGARPAPLGPVPTVLAPAATVGGARPLRAGVSPPKGPQRPTQRSTPAAQPRAIADAAEPGFLVVDAQPWAEVFINAKHVGETPIAAYPMQPGTVRVELKNPETGRALVRSVVVRRGERAYVTGDLR